MKTGQNKPSFVYRLDDAWYHYVISKQGGASGCPMKIEEIPKFAVLLRGYNSESKAARDNHVRSGSNAPPPELLQTSILYVIESETRGAPRLGYISYSDERFKIDPAGGRIYLK